MTFHALVDAIRQHMRAVGEEELAARDDDALMSFLLFCPQCYGIRLTPGQYIQAVADAQSAHDFLEALRIQHQCDEVHP